MTFYVLLEGNLIELKAVLILFSFEHFLFFNVCIFVTKYLSFEDSCKLQENTCYFFGYKIDVA